MIYKDQLDRTITLVSRPQRIVSLVPSQTELLVYLGVEHLLVGITKFCVHPSSLRKEKAVVGGTKTIHLDKIAALKPDLIICNKEENTKEIVDSCALIAPVWVSDIVSVEDNNEMILRLGELLDKDKEASQLVRQIDQAKTDFISFVKEKPVKKVAYCIWKDPFMVAGKETFITSLLALNRFDIISADKTGRYPEVTVDEMKTADIVLLSSEPFPFKPQHIVELKNELQCEIRLVDGEYFSWYGSRLKDAFSYFKTLHSEH